MFTIKTVNLGCSCVPKLALSLDGVLDLGLDEVAAASDLGATLTDGSLAVHLHEFGLVELGLLEDLHLADEDVLYRRKRGVDEYGVNWDFKAQRQSPRKPTSVLSYLARAKNVYAC